MLLGLSMTDIEVPCKTEDFEQRQGTYVYNEYELFGVMFQGIIRLPLWLSW